MNLLIGIINFICSLRDIGEGLRSKRPLTLFTGILFGLSAGAYFYLAVRDGELQVRFGSGADDGGAEV